MNNPPDSASEKFQFACPSCDRKLIVPISTKGKQAKCPHCQGVVQIPVTDVVEVDETIELTSVDEVTVANVDAATSAPPATPVPQTDQAPVTSSLQPEPPSAPKRAETEASRLYDQIRDEVAKVFVGQEELVEGTLIAIFSGGHVLIESVPGLGKTLFVRTLGKILGCEFGRIQFTADLMPSDITGAPIFNMKTQEFNFRPGPVFTQLLLADEINRSPAKTHAALLEIMQERRVTVDGVTHGLDLPFLVLATQNPLESEGTYNLPEAQLDRFMFKLIADYPTEEQEAAILAMHGGQSKLDQTLADDIQTLTNPEQINRITTETENVRGGSIVSQIHQSDCTTDSRLASILHGSLSSRGDQSDSRDSNSGCVFRSRFCHA